MERIKELQYKAKNHYRDGCKKEAEEQMKEAIKLGYVDTGPIICERNLSGQHSAHSQIEF